MIVSNLNSFSLRSSAMVVRGVSACHQGYPLALDTVVPEERQIKVYHELRAATKKAGSATLEVYQVQGRAGIDPAALRAMQDSLRLAFWQEVCDTNGVALVYGDSIWTKGVKEKWPLMPQ